MRYRPLLMFAAVMILVLSTPVLGAEKQGSVALDPQVNAVLGNCAEYLKSANKLNVKAVINFDKMHSEGQLLQYSFHFELFVKRPNRLRAEMQDNWNRNARRLWYDGETITLQDIHRNIYAQIKVPSEIDAALDYAMEHFDVSMPLVDFVFRDPYKSLTAHVKTAFYVGRDYVGSTACHHLAFSEEVIDWQLWIEDSVTPVPRKLVIIYKELEGSPQFVANMTAWNFNLRLPDLVFRFNPPAGARKVEHILSEKAQEMLPTQDRPGKE